MNENTIRHCISHFLECTHPLSTPTSYPGSLPTPGVAGKTLVAAGHVNPQILGVNRISAFLLLRESGKGPYAFLVFKNYNIY